MTESMLKNGITNIAVVSEKYLKKYSSDKRLPFLNRLEVLLEDSGINILKKKDYKLMLACLLKNKNGIREDIEGNGLHPDMVHIKITIYSLYKGLAAFFVSSRAKKSWKAAALLKNEGFHTPEAVAYLIFREHFILKYDYYVTEYLRHGLTVRDFIRLCRAEKIHVIPLLKALAREIASFHNHKLVHGDLKAVNIILDNTSLNYCFYFTDLDRVRKRLFIRSSCLIKDFGALYSSLYELLNTKERNVLITCYIGHLSIRRFKEKYLEKKMAALCKKRLSLVQ